MLSRSSLVFPCLARPRHTHTHPLGAPLNWPSQTITLMLGHSITLAAPGACARPPPPGVAGRAHRCRFPDPRPPAASARPPRDDGGPDPSGGAAPAPPTTSTPPHPHIPLLVRLTMASLWPDRLLARLGRLVEEAGAYVSMARPINLAPSLSLTLVGAAMSGAGPRAALATPAVWGVAAASAAIAFGSCVVNDYFDRGADAVNAPGKPLPAGVVPPDGALLFGGGLYFFVLIGAAFLEATLLRVTVAGSAALTLAYTPLLKRLPLVKNVTVAAVIAAAPAAGALAAQATSSAGAASLPPRVARAVLFVFCAIAGREVMMDVGDVAGDAAAGVATLPVVAGPVAGLVAAAAALAGAAALLAGGVLRGGGNGAAAAAAGAAGLPPMVGTAAAAAATAAVAAALISPPLRALAAGPAGRSRAALGADIDGLLAPVGAGCLLLAGLAV